MSFWKSILSNKADDEIRKLIEEIKGLSDEQRRLLHSRAMSGEPEAAFLLGNAALNRPRTSQNLKIAFTWFERAARAGHSGAIFEIGVMYRRGEGVPRDDGKTVEYWRLAAEKGSAQAQYNLGGLYLRGELVALDIREGVRWTARAAEQGLSHAQYRMYQILQQASSNSTSENESRSKLERAIEWLMAATKSHHPEACLTAGLLALIPELSGSQSDEGRSNDGIRHIGQAAMSGEPHALTLLREVTNTDIGILKNPVTIYALQLLSIREGFLTRKPASRTWQKMTNQQRDRAKAIETELGLAELAPETDSAAEGAVSSVLSFAFGPPDLKNVPAAVVDKAIADARSGKPQAWDELFQIFQNSVSSRLTSRSSSNPLLSLLVSIYGDIEDFHADEGSFIADGIVYPAVNVDLSLTRLRSGEFLESQIRSSDMADIGTILGSKIGVRWCKVSIFTAPHSRN